jgi:prophage regulatory protein
MQVERQLVTKKELKALGIPYSFQHIARLEKAGRFPKRIQLGPCRVAWRYLEVIDWIAERIAERDRASGARISF